MDAFSAVDAECRERHRGTNRPAAIVARGSRPLDLRYCKECGNPYWPSRQDQDFCCPSCRHKFHKRRYERGAQLYDFVMEWRGRRLKGGFTEMCKIVDEWLRDERDRAKARDKVREAYLRQAREGR